MKEQLIITEEQFGNHAIVRSLNHYLRIHWSQHKKYKKTYAMFIRNLMSLQNISKALPNDRYYLNIISYRKRLMDMDNLYGAHKWFIDALCDEGFIWDDDPNHAHITITQQIVKKNTEHTSLQTVVTRDSIVVSNQNRIISI